MNKESKGYNKGVDVIKELTQERLKIAERKVKQFDYEFQDLMESGVSMENHMTKSVLAAREYYRGQANAFRDILENTKNTKV